MKENKNYGGIGFSGLMQVALIVLKLCKVIGWSWWWVFTPTWVVIALLLFTVLLGLWLSR